MIKVPEKIQNLDDSIKELSVHKSFEYAQKAVNSVIRLLGIEDEILWRTFTDTNGKIKSNAGWLMMAEGFADRRGAYKLNIDEKFSLDLKTYWIQKKTDKSKISMLVAITPNFEDEPFYSTKNVGIDFIIPEECDKIVIVLSKNYIIRTVELKDYLSETQKEILSKWLKITDFTNKPQLHEILWQSFDLESVNKQFYKGICEFFTELKQHLVSEKVFDSRHAAYFTNRLIGRMVFCRFLDKKGIISRERKYFDTEGKPSTEYYREKLEVLFFKVFNTPIEDREVGADDKTPFLNGGLFEIKENDKYKDDKLTFPTDYFSRLFEFLKHYNFTTDESTSAFQQVAIDPEMLGKIFENLLAEQVEETGEQARKAKGAFYTPREIVDYMCKESLREYLKTQVTEARDRDDKISLLLDTKPHIWRDQQRNYQKDLEPFKIQIFDALDKAKILDPACGSGAFPMGMMQLLLMCYERLEPRFEAYKTKLNIIKNNLYGVDIEPMAVEISRLRAWLSIIVDKEGDIRKIEPLPNLDFKFVCANSLIPLDKSGQMNLMDDTDLEDKITALRDKYYDEKTVKGKNSLRKEFESLISAKEFGMEKSKKQEQLESYHPFDSENICQFFDPEFMFSQTGFDIVIGNPPYVRADNPSIAELRKKIMKSGKYQTLWEKWDLYVAFIEKGYQLLLKKGIISFIIPDAFMASKYAQKPQEYYIANAKINRINFLSEIKVFEAGVRNIILEMSKDYNVEHIPKRIKHINTFGNAVIMTTKKQEEMKEYTFKIESEKSTIGNFENSILWGEICYVSVGMVLQADEKHWKGEFIKEDLISDKEDKIHQKQYIEAKWAQRYYIEKIKYLEWGTSRVPKKIRRPTFPELYIPEKIMLGGMTGAILDDEGLLANHSIIISVLWHDLKDVNNKSISMSVKKDFDVVNDMKKRSDIEGKSKKFTMKYLLGILNSKLAYWSLSQVRRNQIGFYPDDLKKLPIKIINQDNINLSDKIEELVNLILKRKKINSKADTSELENQIDILVYKLYELTYEEIKTIDPEIGKIINQADYEKMEIE
jgi:hypothetical protein